MTRVLLSTVFRPFGVINRYNKKDDALLLDYLASRLTREPGLFSLSSYLPTSGLHLIGANLGCEVKVLHYPSLAEFIREVKRGYDYVGISFIIKGFPKTVKMISAVRKHAPRTRVIIGGFGTALHDADQMGADYVCRGEGVSFMRRLLRVPPQTPLVHPKIVAEVTLQSLQQCSFLPRHRIGLVVNGFGCPGACEFCSTSAFYGHRQVEFFKSGRELFEGIQSIRAKDPGLREFLIFEEDFLLYKEHVAQFSTLMRNNSDDPFYYGCFASIRAMSEYDLPELVASGFDHVWVGVESATGYFRKQSGSRDVRDLMEELNDLGVTTTCSMIFGLDHHTPENIDQEGDFIIELYPSTAQISNLIPPEGTELHRKLSAQQRIRDEGPLESDLYSDILVHPRFQRGELTTAIFRNYKRLHDTLGPGVFRTANTWLRGYRNLKRSTLPLLQRKAHTLAERLQGVRAVFLDTGPFLPNDQVRERVTEFNAKLAEELGAPSPAQQAMGRLIGRVFAVEQQRRRLYGEPQPEPALTVTRYGHGRPAAKARASSPTSAQAVGAVGWQRRP